MGYHVSTICMACSLWGIFDALCPVKRAQAPLVLRCLHDYRAVKMRVSE